MLSLALTEKNHLDQYVKKGFITQAELEQLDKTTLEYLNQYIVFYYVQQQKISISRIKSLTPDEYRRLSDHSMTYVILSNQLPMEEYLTLSSRRAIVLSAIHVVIMMCYFVINSKEAVALNNTFDFLYEFSALSEDVLARKVSPELAIKIYEYLVRISVDNSLEHIAQSEPEAKSYNLPLSFNPATATQYCALIHAIPYLRNAIAEHRGKIIDSTSNAVMNYIMTMPPSTIPHYLTINLKQRLVESKGYKDYCSGVMTSNFRFFQSTKHVETKQALTMNPH